MANCPFPSFLRRTNTLSFFACGLALATPFFSAAQETRSTTPGPLTLWYKQPAAQWVEALPLGNGRLGAMVFGGIEMERIQLNEDTLWAGGPYDPSHPEALAALPEIRRLVAAGELREAQELAQKKFMARPMGQAPYQTLGDLVLTMSGSEYARNYRRELDLDTAIARTEFQIGGTRYTREMFISPVDQALVIHIAAHANSRWPARINLGIALNSRQSATPRTEGDNLLVLSGVNGDFGGIKGALKFEARLRVSTDGGRVSGDGAQLHVADAKSVTIVLAAATSYRRFDDVTGDPAALNSRTLAALEGKSLEQLRAAHIAEHQRLFRRVAIDLGHSDAGKLPTDERVRRMPHAVDPQLAALYFQYGRYLLISSSRPGTQPANLQGIWNDHLSPPWGSKYTININTEMNYWPAETTNLAECIEPLFKLVEDISHTGAALAQKHYGAHGWVAHHNTDLWRATGPIDGAFWGLWPTGGAWLCLSLWEHYRFSGDRAVLERLYPLMKGSAEFFLDTLVEEPTHRWLVTSPSISPENAHHEGVSIAAGPAMDNQILRDLFDACIESARTLGRDADFASQLTSARDRLPPDQIGAQGQLQEWLEDWDAGAPEQTHRHVSHLYAFFPSNQITLRGTPDLAAAVRKTLETRGDISTGWAIAWRLNLWARMQDGNRAHRILGALLDPERTYPNLFDAHPPFQIDGNFGGTAAIAEMLLQSHTDEIELLPALPDAWPTGQVRGLRARGGFTVDLEWRGGALVSAALHGAPGAQGRVRRGQRVTDFAIPADGTFTWSGQ